MVGLALIAGGIAAGVVGSLLGLGGGILIVPLLTLGFGLPLREAVGASLVCVIVTSGASAGVYLERHIANLRLGMTLELFTATGAINDRGTYTGYRSVKGQIAKVRNVTVGTKGTITFVITIDLSTGSSAWTITSGTKSYAGLRGKGTLTVDNYESNPYTFVMKGTVSR